MMFRRRVLVPGPSRERVARVVIRGEWSLKGARKSKVYIKRASLLSSLEISYLPRPLGPARLSKALLGAIGPLLEFEILVPVHQVAAFLSLKIAITSSFHGIHYPTTPQTIQHPSLKFSCNRIPNHIKIFVKAFPQLYSHP